MSHFDSTIGNTPPSSPSTLLQRPKGCETFFRHEETREEIALDFRSKTPLDFVLNKDLDPLYVIDIAVGSFGSIYASDVCDTFSGYEVKLFLSNFDQYLTLKRGGLDIDGVHLRPTTCTPDRIKVNFTHVAPHCGIDDFRDIFKDYGVVVEIAKHYMMFKDKKVYTSDGFVILDRSSRQGQYKTLYPVVPAVILRPNKSPVSTSTDYSYPLRTWTNPFAVPAVTTAQSQLKPQLLPENKAPPQSHQPSPSTQKQRTRKKHQESMVQEKTVEQGMGHNDFFKEGKLCTQDEPCKDARARNHQQGANWTADQIIRSASADGKSPALASPPPPYKGTSSECTRYVQTPLRSHPIPFDSEIFYDAVEYF
ncbi:hypothetical protein BGZ72_000490 [Mortierella alpina]|nr:hypothetical protein BGZ72_000490 [Mortierella alpina]